MSNPIPALCGSCGLFWGATNIVGGPGSATVTFVGGRVSCPRCGSLANILDGTYQMMGDAVRILSTSKHSALILSSLAQSLNDATQQNKSPEEIKAVIKEHVPELSSVADLIPRNKSEAYDAAKALAAILTVCVAAGALYMSATKEKPSPTINNTFINVPQATAPSRHERRKAASQARRKPKPKKAAPKRGEH